MDISPTGEGVVEPQVQVVEAVPPEVPQSQDPSTVPPFFDLLMKAFDQWTSYWVPVTALLLVPTILSVGSEFIKTSMPYESQIVAIVGALVSYVVGCGVIAVALGYKETRASVVAAFRASLELAWPLLLIAFLRGMVTIGAFGLLILPGIYMSIMTMFAQFVAVREDKRGFDAIAESWRIASPQAIAIFWRLCVLGVLGIVVAMVFGLVVGGAGATVSGMATNAFMNLVLVPVGLFFSVAVYESVRGTPVFGPSQEMRAKWLTYFAVLGVVVLLALLVFVGYALVEYAPNVLENTTLRFNPPGLSL